MSEYLVKGETLTALADAIRSKTGGTDSMTPEQMITNISNMESTPSGDYIEYGLNESGEMISATVHGTVVPANAFYYCQVLASIILPEELTTIAYNAFYNCSNLALTSLPEGITSIGNSAFYGCSNLALTSLPESITSIEYNAFSNCPRLTSLTFKGTPQSISMGAFNGCTNLTNIYVPWAEGAVSDAPWGADNVTITYNYTPSNT